MLLNGHGACHLAERARNAVHSTSRTLRFSRCSAHHLLSDARIAVHGRDRARGLLVIVRRHLLESAKIAVHRRYDSLRSYIVLTPDHTTHPETHILPRLRPIVHSYPKTNTQQKKRQLLLPSSSLDGHDACYRVERELELQWTNSKAF